MRYSAPTQSVAYTREAYALDSLFAHVFNVILPVLICAAVGYAMAVRKLPFDHAVIGSVVRNVGYPTLILSHLASAKIEIGSFLSMLGASATAILAFGILGFIVLKLLRLPVRAFLTPMMHGNVGNVGLPITLLALGSAGMAYTMGFVVAVLVSIFTIGMWIPAGKFSPKEIATSPVIYAVLLALVSLGTGWSLPAPVNTAFGLLGGMAIPLMLLTLGHTLATLKVQTLGRATLLTVLHLGMALAISLGVAPLFGLPDVGRSAFVICCFMPSSVATYLFIEQYFPEHAPEVAGFILVSTLATLAVIPVVLTYLI
ncbi:MAG: AEC family transporter [Pseudomonadota bacterium]